ncbi:MAG: UDP-3-O-(3-hydroxymyristoyl)glucosamine N-acyltransferase [Fibrobacter sp.]|nr:UDP-3-O-(3-hydroxymyristoyl)glucosamine N-acyltransferase [Fibrobacter sp.]
MAHILNRGLAIKSLSAKDLADFLDAEYKGSDGITVNMVSPVAIAPENALSFWTSLTVKNQLRQTRAGVLLVPKDFDYNVPAQSLIFVEDPYLALLQVLEEFHKPLVKFSPHKVHGEAQVHKSAVVEGVVQKGAVIGPGCVVSKGAVVGAHSVLEANVCLYDNVHIGENTVLQAGVVVGSRGYGFAGENNSVAVPHYAGVKIGDNVEIGANSVVAAGFITPTVVGDGCKIDTFVQIAHNCVLGKNVFMVSGAGLAGGVCVGDGVEIGGGAKVAGDVYIGNYAKIAALSGVTKNINPQAVVAGFPAQPINQWRRQVVAGRR